LELSAGHDIIQKSKVLPEPVEIEQGN
jgi:hypothetical protein